MPTYTDTGLGWYAYEDWVRQESGLLGKLVPSGGGGGGYPELPYQPIPYFDHTPTAAEVKSAGFYVGYHQGAPSNFVGVSIPDIYISSTTQSGALIHDCHAATHGVTSVTFTMWMTSGNGDSDIGSRTVTLNNNDRNVMWGYMEFTVAIMSSSNALMPLQVTNLSSIIQEPPTTGTSFYKFLPGYCVACIAEWGVRGESGSYIGPILVSTESQYVALSIDDEDAYSGHVWYEDLPAPGERVYFQAIRDFSLPDWDSSIEDLTVPYIDLGLETLTDTQIAQRILQASGWHWGTYEDDDPYEEAGESQPGSGPATFDFSSTEIPYGDLPTIGAFATGMVDVYIPTRTELVALSQYLWAGSFDVDNFKKIVADPMDVIIGLHIVPLTALQIGTTSSTLVVGNISTGLSMDKATKQYVEVDMGTLEILPKWGAYLDFSPYSKMTLFLPYIGYVDVSPDDCMNGSISVKYYVDIIGGSCVAQVKCNDHVLYQFSGMCSCQLPVTAGQYQNIAIAGMNILGSLFGGMANMAMPLGNNDDAAMSGMLGQFSSAFGTIGSIGSNVLSMYKPAIQRSGGFGSSSGLMGIQKPYLILTVPRMCVPGEQNKYIGYPSFVTKVMNTLSGFNSVQVTHLNNMSCTAEEADEIIALLSQGVIF